jgi:hypothetical protein
MAKSRNSRMFWMHSTKITLVNRQDAGNIEAFRQCNDSRIHEIKPQIGILIKEFIDTLQIILGRANQGNGTLSQTLNKLTHRHMTEPRMEQVRGFYQDNGR